MRIRFALCILLISACAYVSAQQSTDSLRGNARKLDAGDLIFKQDTAEMNVTSASRSSKRVGELPITIYVVTREEIILNHYNSLIDVLKSLPGVMVSQPGSGELGESFELRGLVGNLYTLILINGLPIKPSGVVGMPIGAQLPIREAERIEVIYGPAAAVYGADAVSGVINIITKEADKGTFVSSNLGLGLLDYRNGDFMVGGKTGKNKNILQYTFYGGLSEVSDVNIKDGYNDAYNPLHYLQDKGVKYNIGSTSYDPLKITESVLSQGGINPADFIKENYPSNYEGSLTMPDMENFPASSNHLGFQLKYRGVSMSFNNMYRRTHSSISQSPYMYKYNNPQNYWGDNIRSTTLSYNHEWTPRFMTTTNLSSLVYKMDNNSNFGVTFINNTDQVYRYAASRDILFEQLFTVMPSGGLEIMSGLTYQYSGNLPLTNFLESPFRESKYNFFSTKIDLLDTLTNNFGFNPLVYHNFSVFSQAYYSVKSFRFMGGVRFDDNSRYGMRLSPRLAGLYIMSPRTSFRGSVSFAYKAPASSLAYQSLAVRTGKNPDSLLYLSIPNHDLEPEQFMAVELGLIKKTAKGFNFNLSLYYNEIRNNIIESDVLLKDLHLPLAVLTSDSARVFQPINVKHSIYRFYGLQATFKTNDIVKSIHLNGELSLTVARKSTEFPDILQYVADSLSFSNFKLVPKHNGQLKVSMRPTRNLYVQVTSTWASSWLRVIIPVKSLYEQLLKDYDGFYSMDIVADYKIGANINSFIKVTNVFDERYGGRSYSGLNTPLPYNPQTGRSISFGLTYTLN